MENKSGFSPLGRAVLVKYYDAPERRESVIVIPPTVQDRLNMLEQQAVIVEVGPVAWPDEPPRAKVGDTVMISRMAGVAAVGPADGLAYRFVNDRDIFAVVTHKE